MAVFSLRLILYKKEKQKENGIFGLYMWPFWDSDGGPGWSGMVDMPILDRYKIGGRKRLADGVIFWGEYLILVTK